MAGHGYSTIQIGEVSHGPGTLLRSGAVVIGVAIGLCVLLIGGAPQSVSNYVDRAVSSRPTSVAVRPQHFGAFPAPLLPAQLPQRGVNAQEDVFVETAQRSQTSSMWTTAGAFIAGCAFAVMGLALQLRPRTHKDTRDAESVAMFAIGGTQELRVVPPHIGKDKDPNSFHRRFEDMLRKGQDKVCAAIEQSDGVGKFRTDAWMREDGGGGVSRVLAGGKVWEKAGVNLSVVWGTMPQAALAAATEKAPEYIKKMNLKPTDRVPFFACGLSCVMHPRNPHCPTMHFNYRYFEIDEDNWWFGGGTDITPAYLDEDDMKHFHGTYKKVCDKYDPYFYDEFKKWADEYFCIKHRGETRGLGGIFFDDLNDREKETIFKFAEECLDSVVPAYVPIIEKHKEQPFTEEQKKWQLLRRGRYTEFNLVYDRGTIFGLKAGGRIESILMTLPELASWEYDHHPAPGSEEAKIMDAFKNPRSWV